MAAPWFAHPLAAALAASNRDLRAQNRRSQNSQQNERAVHVLWLGARGRAERNRPRQVETCIFGPPDKSARNDVSRETSDSQRGIESI